MSFLNSRFCRFLSLYLIFSFVSQTVFAQNYKIENSLRQQNITADSLGRQGTQLPSLNTESSEDAGGLGLTPQIMGGVPSLGVGVPNIKVHVLGEVQSPGIYNVSLSNRVTDVLRLAVPKRSSQRIIQIRSQGSRTKNYDLYRYYYNGDLSQNPYLEDNEVVFVPPHHGIVRIEGPVVRPGLYEILNEKNVQDIIQLAGGLSTGASRIYDVKVLRFSEEGKQFIENIKNTKRDLTSFKIMKGDIVVIPDIINNPKKFDYTVEAIPGENSFYPTSTPNVFVLGSVGAAGSYPYKSHLRVKDYVSYASPNATAQLNNITMIRNGKRSKLKFDERPNPGDILVVKEKIRVGTIVSVVSTAMSLVLTSLLLEATLNDRF